MGDLRLGKRALHSPKLLAELREKGVGTQAAQFRLGRRILEHREAVTSTRVSVGPSATKAPAARKRGTKKAVPAAAEE